MKHWLLLLLLLSLLLFVAIVNISLAQDFGAYEDLCYTTQRQRAEREMLQQRKVSADPVMTHNRVTEEVALPSPHTTTACRSAPNRLGADCS